MRLDPIVEMNYLKSKKRKTGSICAVVPVDCLLVAILNPNYLLINNNVCF